MFPVLVASLRDLLRPSTTMRNNRGERGQPYLIPLLDLKKGEATPLIRIAKDIELMQLITQVTKP
jgi:hypothetical protein